MCAVCNVPPDARMQSFAVCQGQRARLAASLCKRGTSTEGRGKCADRHLDHQGLP